MQKKTTCYHPTHSVVRKGVAAVIHVDPVVWALLSAIFPPECPIRTTKLRLLRHIAVIIYLLS